MPDLNFEVVSAVVKPFAVIPTIEFLMKIENKVENEEVYAAALKCQIIIEPRKRNYDEATKENLFELFGEPSRWEETLNNVLWTILTVPVPRFTGTTEIKVSITCSEDQSLAAGKYFYGVRDNLIPLAFLFSGTLFFKGADEKLQITQISWEKEALYKMPASIWHEMINSHFPNIRWLRVRKEIYDRLVKYKSQGTFPTLELCLESILDEALNNNKPIEKQNA